MFRTISKLALCLTAANAVDLTQEIQWEEGPGKTLRKNSFAWLDRNDDKDISKLEYNEYADFLFDFLDFDNNRLLDRKEWNAQWSKQEWDAYINK